MYSQDLGRFLQPDPLGYIDGPNLYTFVYNNSINIIDPLGLAGNDTGIPFPSVWQILTFDILYLTNSDVSDRLQNDQERYREWIRNKIPALRCLDFTVHPIVLHGTMVGMLGVPYSPNQQALVELAKQAQRTGLTVPEAKVMLKWAQEYNVQPALNHINTNHWTGGPHIRIGLTNHIPVR
jgi:hypothetical protein